MIEPNTAAIGLILFVIGMVIGRVVLKGLGINNKKNNPGREVQYKDVCEANVKGINNRLDAIHEDVREIKKTVSIQVQ